MSESTITVEIDEHHTFEVEPTGERDVWTEARAILEGSCAVERREDGSFTLYPVSRVTAVYIGTVPKREVGFPTLPDARG